MTDLHGAIDESEELVSDFATAKLCKEAIRAAVMREMFCPITGDVLDMRTAFLVTAGAEGFADDVKIVSPKAWDLGAAKVVAAVNDFPGAFVKVLHAPLIDARLKTVSA